MKKISKIYKIGDTRVIKKFLFFPCTLKRDEKTRETRWLEYASIKQIYDLQFDYYNRCSRVWINVKFVD